MIDVTINTKKCKFCEALEFKKFLAKGTKAQPHEYRTEFSVALVDRIFIPGRKGPCAQSTDYRKKGCGYTLNFCPECGKSLKRRSIPCPIHSDDIGPYDFSQKNEEETK